MPSLKKLLFCLLLLFCLSLLLMIKYPVLASLLVGEARITRAIDATVYLNSKKQDDVKVFHHSSNFDGSPANRYIIHGLHDERPYPPAYVVDISYNFTATPNSMNRYHYAVLGPFLIQDEQGMLLTGLSHYGGPEPGYDAQIKCSSAQLTFLLIPHYPNTKATDSARIVLD